MKQVILFLTVLLLGVGTNVALSQEAEMKQEEVVVEEEVMMEEETQPVKVGNKICPISSEEIGSMGKAVEVEYQGKVYNLCCAMCVKMFNADPDKYVGMIDQQMMAE